MDLVKENEKRVNEVKTIRYSICKRVGEMLKRLRNL